MNGLLSLSSAEIWLLLIQQSIQVTVLIVCVLGLVRLLAKNRPHLAHAMWGLVLLKCLTPPIFALPLSPFSHLQMARASQDAKSEVSVLKTRDQMRTALGMDRKSSSQHLSRDLSHPAPWRMSNDGSLSRSDSLSGTLPSASIDAALTQKPAPSDRRGESFISWAVTVWAISAVICLMLAAMRLAVFLRKIQDARVAPHASTREMLGQLLQDMPKRRFFFRRTVRVVVVDRLIGPAVVGLIRPTILLPRVLEAECTASELRILLAHELTHIWRGDLWWALLQTVARCLWWFHPLVYWVSRWFDRVTELSCDEETVAGLHCPPAEYARSLLAVLERKHLLHSAPALPGVRPVDLTAKRMERIMKLTSNAKAHRPWWVVPVMLMGAAFVLPGAALTIADDQDTSERTKHLNGKVQHDPTAGPLPRIRATFPATDAPQFVKTYDAKQAIERIKQEEECDDAAADRILYSSLSNTTRLLPNIKSEIPTGLVVDGNRVIVRGNESSHQRVKKELQRIEKHGFSDQVVIETRFIAIESLTFSKLEFDWNLLPQKAEFTPVLVALLNPAETRSLVQKMQADGRDRVIHAPRCTFLNGQEGTVTDMVQRPFVVGHKNPAGEESEDAIRFANEGVDLTLCPVVEARFVSLDVQYHRSSIAKVDTFSFQAGGETRTVQNPRVASQQFQVKMSFPHGHSLAYAMPDLSDGDIVSIVILTATPLSKLEQREALGMRPKAPTAVANSDVMFGEQRIEFAPGETKPASEVHGDSMLMKADGPRMSEDDTQSITQAIREFGWLPNLEGTFEYKVTDEKIVLKGKNVSISGERDELRITSSAAEIVFDLVHKSMRLRAESELEITINDSAYLLQGKELSLSENGLQLIGTPLRFEVKEHALKGECEKLAWDDDLQFSCNVKLQTGDAHLAADKVELREDLPQLQLRGNVSYSPQSGQAVSTMKAPMLDYDLKTGSVEFE